MSRFFYLIAKSTRNIVARPLSAITSLLSLLLLFLMFDLVWISALSSGRYLAKITTDIDMELFLDDSLPDSTLSVVLRSISDMDGINEVQYIDKETARDKLDAMMGADLLEGLSDNPLPRSIIISFTDQYQNSAYLADLERNFGRLTGVSEIYYPKSWLEKIENTRSLVIKIVIFLGIVISLAVILNLLHSIRLSARSRGQELLQHRLLGAGRAFLSVPYILEGIFYSLAAAVAGWVVIFYAFGRLSFQGFDIVFPGQYEIVYFCVAAVIIGLLGGYTGIRRSLR